MVNGREKSNQRLVDETRDGLSTTIKLRRERQIFERTNFGLNSWRLDKDRPTKPCSDEFRLRGLKTRRLMAEEVNGRECRLKAPTAKTLIDLKTQDKSIKCANSRRTVVKVLMVKFKTKSWSSRPTALPTRRPTTDLQDNTYRNEGPRHRHTLKTITLSHRQISTRLNQNSRHTLTESASTLLTIFDEKDVESKR